MSLLPSIAIKPPNEFGKDVVAETLDELRYGVVAFVEGILLNDSIALQ